jgi:hypothetical protein
MSLFSPINRAGGFPEEKSRKTKKAVDTWRGAGAYMLLAATGCPGGATVRKRLRFFDK